MSRTGLEHEKKISHIFPVLFSIHRQGWKNWEAMVLLNFKLSIGVTFLQRKYSFQLLGYPKSLPLTVPNSIGFCCPHTCTIVTISYVIGQLNNFFM